jgi:hypothetical protein
MGDWSYDLYVSYDTTDHDQTMHHAVLKNRVQELLNAADGGNSLCAGGFNPFGVVNSSNISQQCLDYMTTNATSTENLDQTIVQGTVQGALFKLPAGDVRMAVLGAWRENTYEYNPNSDLAAQNIEAVLASLPAEGDINVSELALQFEVPVLNSLTMGAAYRLSDYSTAGRVDSYEGDLKWRPVDSLLIRTSYQRAVRAPNIGELFAAAVGSQVAFGTPPGAIGDPCDVRSSARTGAGGASVRQLCLDQGNSDRRHRYLRLPDHGDGRCAQRQSGARAGDRRHLQHWLPVDVRLGVGVDGRHVGLPRLLQHRDQRRDLGRAGTYDAEQVLQPRRVEHEL